MTLDNVRALMEAAANLHGHSGGDPHWVMGMTLADALFIQAWAGADHTKAGEWHAWRAGEGQWGYSGPEFDVNGMPASEYYDKYMSDRQAARKAHVGDHHTDPLDILIDECGTGDASPWTF